MTEIIYFSISALNCGITIYILARLWFTDTANRKLHSLFALGMTVFFYNLFNAISMITQDQFYPFFYTLRMIMVCIVPYTILWFFLTLTRSKAAQSKIVYILMSTISSIDILMLVTNPLHKFYFTDYVYPHSPTGPFFWVHAVTAYIVILLALIVLIRYIVKYVRTQPLLLLAGLGTLLPYIFNILFTFEITGFGHDLTPFGFFISLMILIYLSYRMGLLDISMVAFAGIFASMGDIMIILDKDNVIVNVNNSLKTYFPDFKIEKGITTLSEFIGYLKLHMEACSNEKLFEEIQHISDEGEFEGDFDIRTAEGVVTFTPSKQSVGKEKHKSGHVLALSDITDYRKMISEMAQLKTNAEAASEAKGAFLANMSHEMRTPLNAIIGMTSIAQSTDSEVKKNECAERVEEASVHLLGVINDILDMSKIEANKLELVKAAFDFKAMLVHTVDFIKYTINEKNIVLKMDIASDIPKYLVGDEQRIAQAITNLLSNAAKFTNEDGEISFRAKLLSCDEDICIINIEVEDNGIGIDEESQKQLFSSFQQADSSISRKYGGTGLGLAITKNIIEASGGEMHMTSRPEKGSLFGFTIPMAKGNASSDMASLGEDVKSETIRKNMYKDYHVLLAEDVDINREILTALLEPTGIHIDTARNGNEAIDLFIAAPETYDAIFMDIQMPEKDGYQATREIRALNFEKAKNIPIIAMTANVFREDIDRCFDCGMNSHIGKPIDIGDVVTCLNEHLEPLA